MNQIALNKKTSQATLAPQTKFLDHISCHLTLHLLHLPPVWLKSPLSAIWISLPRQQRVKGTKLREEQLLQGRFKVFGELTGFGEKFRGSWDRGGKKRTRRQRKFSVRGRERKRGRG